MKTANTTKEEKGKKRHAGYSAQARARMGRPAKHPEIPIIMRRYGVSYTHAYQVVAGLRAPKFLAGELESIRREIAAGRATA